MQLRTPRVPTVPRGCFSQTRGIETRHATHRVCVQTASIRRWHLLRQMIVNALTRFAPVITVLPRRECIVPSTTQQIALRVTLVTRFHPEHAVRRTLVSLVPVPVVQHVKQLLQGLQSITVQLATPDTRGKLAKRRAASNLRVLRVLDQVVLAA